MTQQSLQEPNQNKKILILFSLNLFLVAANLRPSITAIGPLAATIHQWTHLSSGSIGMLTTFPLLAFAVVSPIVSGVAHRLSTEKTLFLSMVLLTLGIVARSSLPGNASLFLGTVMIGVAVTFGNVLLPSLIKDWTPKQAGLMTGIFTVSLGLFAGLGSGLSIPLAVNARLGWKGSLLSWALLSLLTVFLLPSLVTLQKRKVRLAGFAASDEKKASDKRTSLWRNAAAWQVLLFMGFQSLLFYAMTAWLPSILANEGLTLEQGGWMFLLVQIISLPASFGTPLLVAKFAGKGQREITVGLSALYLIGFLGLMTGQLLFIWVICLGIASGSTISLALLFFAHRTRSPRQAAQLSGMAQSGGYFLASLGPFVVGMTHDLSHGWFIPEVILVGCSALFLLFAVGAGKNTYIE